MKMQATQLRYLDLTVFYFSVLTMATLTNAETLKVNVTGDVIIGAMFPVHVLGDGDQCGSEINDQNGLQNLEALLFALDKVNREILNNLGM